MFKLLLLLIQLYQGNLFKQKVNFKIIFFFIYLNSALRDHQKEGVEFQVATKLNGSGGQ